MSDELKPVPCGCGGEAKIRGNKYFKVQCQNCYTETDFLDTKEEAIKAWNTAMTPRCCMTCVHWHMCCCCDETKPREVCENWEGW